ncbi:MAG: glycosyl transferase [Clostridium sp.]
MNAFMQKISNPRKWMLWLLDKKIAYLIPDKTYLSLKYWALIEKKINLICPTTFNEKLQWLKLYDRRPKYTQMVDKYEVRNYISKTIGEEYLIPLIGVYDKFEEIDFNNLPKQFVLKCNHDSGGLIICKDKSKLDIKVARHKINKSLKRNYYYVHREWPYKNVRPRIICETFISEKNKTPDDYKVLCFNGKAKLISVHIDRFGKHKLDNYNMKWEKTIIGKDGPMSEFTYEKPKQFEKLIQLTELLAANMIHVRIDWFIVKDKLYFGEITFYEASGFEHFDNEEDNYLFGSWINLPIEKSN